MIRMAQMSFGCTIMMLCDSDTNVRKSKVVIRNEDEDDDANNNRNCYRNEGTSDNKDEDDDANDNRNRNRNCKKDWNEENYEANRNNQIQSGTAVNELNFFQFRSLAAN